MAPWARSVQWILIIMGIILIISTVGHLLDVWGITSP